MEINEKTKGNTINIILKRKQTCYPKKNKTKRKVKKKKNYNNEKKQYLKNNEVCFLSPKFKPTSKF